MMQPLKILTRFVAGMAFAALLGCGAAQAEISGSLSHGLGKALTTSKGAALYKDSGTGGGFSLSGSYFSGFGSGNELSGTLFGDGLQDMHGSDLAGDQRVYALLLDGSYDFNRDADESLPLHPYIGGGVGMAMAGGGLGNTAAFGSTNGDMVPLFRIGGGVTYRLGSQWNLSLDYKAGFTGPGGGDQLFTGRGQQPIDMQTLNMGLKYQF